MKKLRQIELLSWRYLLIYAIYALACFLLWYFMLPAFNFRNPGFYLYFALLVSVPFGIGFSILAKLFFKNANKVNTKAYKCKMKLEKFISIEEPESDSALLFTGAIVSSAIILILTLIFLLTGVKLFNARNYSEQLEITQGNHEDLNTIFDYDSGEVLLPRIDKDLAFKLAEAKLGDYGSQYSIDYDNFTLISVNRNGTTELIRVTPLEYATPFVALSRMNKGTIGYIEVNVITQEAKLIKFEDGEGLKYMPSGVFSKDLDRHIRFNYPSTMYNNKYFEIDNEGNPYWVVPTIKKEIGMFSGDNNNGVLVINPRTGEIKSYKLGDNLPEWLQRAIDETVIAEQANNALTYANGYFNTIFAKKDVFQLSDGYNYFIKDGETWYVSCITSPNNSDQTSVGFLIVNLKTKETIRYYSPGITEMRAREIAVGDARVKAQNFDSTWPILITYHDVPTYFVVLKNEVQSQKIVLVNVEDGTLVAIGDTLEEAKQEYETLLANKGAISGDSTDSGTFVVDRIRDLGDKIQFTVVGNEETYFEVSVSLNLDARFLKEGDTIEITYKENSMYNIVLTLEQK